MECSDFDSYVKEACSGYGFCFHTPEGAMRNYRSDIEELKNVRIRLKNPVKKNGEQLKLSTVRQYESRAKELARAIEQHKKLIKKLVKHNLLPTSKYISGEAQSQFVFSVWTMLMIPELGKAVYFANRLIDSRYDRWMTHSTNAEYDKWLVEAQCRGARPSKKEERSRESMFDALIENLNLAIANLQEKRQSFIFPDVPWQKRKHEETTDTAKEEIKAKEP